MTFSANGGTLNTPGTPATADQVGPYQVLGGINTSAKGGSAYLLRPPSYSRCTIRRPAYSGWHQAAISFPVRDTSTSTASLFKIIAISEKIKVEIRGEAFSVTNTPHWNNPDTNVSDANYGYITGASGGRGMQLGAKFSF